MFTSSQSVDIISIKSRKGGEVMQCKACGAEMVKGRLVSTYCSHFVLDDGTVEYGGKEVESFPVKHNGFWKGMVEAVT